MFERHHLRRLPRVWVKHPVYFVTVCVAARKKLLDCQAVAEILRSAWRSSPTLYGWVIGRYVIMPDHIHFFAAPRPEAKSLGDFLRDWKKWTGRQIAKQRWASPPIWQPEFFDHVLRSAKSYAEKWEYVRENPVRAHLVRSAEAWPFAGEIEVLTF